MIHSSSYCVAVYTLWVEAKTKSLVALFSNNISSCLIFERLLSFSLNPTLETTSHHAATYTHFVYLKSIQLVSLSPKPPTPFPFTLFLCTHLPLRRSSRVKTATASSSPSSHWWRRTSVIVAQTQSISSYHNPKRQTKKKKKKKKKKDTLVLMVYTQTHRTMYLRICSTRRWNLLCIHCFLDFKGETVSHLRLYIISHTQYHSL